MLSMRLRYNLEWLESGQARRDLAPGHYVLGRGGRIDLIFDIPGVSREHAEVIVCADRGLLVRDLGSTNGTRVDGQRITEGAWCGDIDLQLGSCVQLRLRERGGLDQLALALVAVPDAALSAPEERPTAAATAVQSLLRELRLTFDAWRPRTPGPWSITALTGLLQRWCELAMVPYLQLQREDAEVVLAQVGRPAPSPVLLAEHAGWQLVGEVANPAAHALAEVGGELLRWALPVAAPVRCEPAAQALHDWPGVPSSAPVMRSALAPLQRAAAASISVVLLGETGVGKELVAQWMHRTSPRSTGPFLAINCAALPRDLLEAELFGVERGAATGVQARPGLFEQAHAGTLFLDEVGDMAVETQVRLLRALEDGRLLRVGGHKPLNVDVRVIAATNRDLDAEVAAGRFRLDLYHRLAGYTQRIPPLRERCEDIAPLALNFFQLALARSGRCSPGITAAALLALQRWHWPGNVRELRQVIDRAVILLDDGEALDRSHLPEGLRAGAAPDAAALRLETALQRAEREALLAALAVAGGEHERAWTLLCIGKTSFYKKLREHSIGRTAVDP
jgi:DNA-binding NtrC family response regulator